MNVMKRSTLALIAILILATAPFTACITEQQNEQNQAKNDFDALDAKKSVIKQQIDSGKQDIALKGLRTLLRSHPEDPDLNLLFGFVQLTLRNAVVAIKYIDKAYKLEPTVANGLNLSSAYIEAGQYQNARNLLFSLIKKDKENAKNAYLNPERLYHNIALTYYREKNLSRAESFFRRALEENPVYYLSKFLLGKLYEDTGRKALARQTYAMILDSCAHCYDPMSALVMSYLQDGMVNQANKIVSNYLHGNKLEEADLTRAKSLKQVVARVTNSKKQNP